MTAAVTAGQAPHGRTTISARAVRRVVSAVTADALGVSASEVSVALSDERGVLRVEARTPIHVDPLGATGSESAGRQTSTLLDRVVEAQNSIRTRCLQLTGSTIGRVDVRITAVDLRERRRVA